MGALIDLTGQRFGRLTVLSQAGYKYGRVAWLCRCDCGKTSVATSNDLRRGKVISCGCANNEARASHAKAAGMARGQQMKKHGQAGTRLYHVWKSMRQRCENPNDTSYPDYGGRGITVCSEWSTFPPFMKWALENGYDPDAPFGKCTIDRKNNNKGYSPDNCRWVSLDLQANNRRKRRRTHAAD